MKILNAEQIHQWDAYTVMHEPISSIDLMERAALRCVEWLQNKGLARDTIRVFCGKGNNGGDGLAIARLLMQLGLQPVVYILEFGAMGTEDFQVNLQRLHKLTADIHFLPSADFFPAIEKTDLVIDAIFGSGLNRPLQSVSAELVKHINRSGAKVISVDVPSGMPLEMSCKNNPVICAEHTLSFQSLKRCFLMAENADFFGEITVLDIELHPAFLEMMDTGFEIIARSQVGSLIRPRKAFSHKGTYGHALLIAGNTGKAGAGVLASKACLRSGAGLLTVNIPEALSAVIHTAIPEAMVMFRGDAFPDLSAYKSIGIGPGLGLEEKSETLLKHILDHYSGPLLLDADALTILSKHPGWLSLVPAGAVLSPHPKEFDRLFGDSANDFERADKAISLSKTYPVTIVLKGHYTLVAANGRGWYNSTGNAGLAKAGSGDVLSGIITSLLAQSYPSLQAAIIGVYLHGLAADLALEQQSMESLLATDVIDMLGWAIREICHKNLP